MDDETKDRYRNLARNLCAAYIADRLGIGLTYTLKNHVQDDPGTYWFILAEAVDEFMQKSLEDRMKAVTRN